ncbi:MAG: phosphate/phosphite/phosphonate ABC transporter substrate-binding protein [Candidatus Delongbacteria bacterium]|jgi:phosphonate transport system substrate-binding protein|nr:phosphate/phosphite/phosphonate ABC transporter substrate-binding protein [Candidatus Delongbacteria bacterium]
MTILKRAYLLLLIFILSIRLFPQNKITFGLHPCDSYDQMTEKYIPLMDYLSKKIGFPISIKIGLDIDDHIQAINDGTVDIAVLAPYAYIYLVDKYGKKDIFAIFETSGSPFLKGNIITLENSSINTVEDIINCNLAFVNKKAAMGYLMQMNYILKNSTKIPNLKTYKFLNNHDNVCLAVLSGDFDAGAVKYESYLKYKDKGLRSLVEFDSIPEHIIVSRNGLDKEIVAKIKKALLEIKLDKNGEQILKTINPLLTGFVPAKDSDFDGLREIVKYLKEKGVVE